MNTSSDNKIAFTFASSEVNIISQQFIKLTELLTGKIKLKKLYDQYLLENNSPKDFWIDAVKKLKFNLQCNYHDGSFIPKEGRIIIVANHVFGVADGVSLCSIVSKISFLALNGDSLHSIPDIFKIFRASSKILPFDIANNNFFILISTYHLHRDSMYIGPELS